MTKEFVTLPRDVVEQALNALDAGVKISPNSVLHDRLRAAPAQPQNHVSDAGNMVMPDEIDCANELRRHSRKLCEPIGETAGVMQRAADEIEQLRAMLAAAPQPPALEQPQVEQEPVAEVHFVLPQYHDAKQAPTKTVHLRVDVPVGTKLYTLSQPPRQPLTDEQIDRYIGPDEGDREAVKEIVRQVERAHGVGQAAAPQPPALEQPQVEQEPVAWIEHEWSGSGLRNLHFERPAPTVRDEVVCPVWTPLYTLPQPKREPLTDDEIADEVRGFYSSDEAAELGFPDDSCTARAIERAHNIK